MRGQHQPRRADRHVQPQRARRPVAKAVHHVERRLDLAQAPGRAAPAGARPASVGTTLRVVRLSSRTPSCASSRRTASLRPDALAPLGACAVAKAPGARHRHEGVQITEIDLHCSPFRTACADCTGLSRAIGNAYLRLVRQGDTTMTSIDQSGTFTLGDRTVKRLGYGAMQLAGPGVFGPPKDRDAALAVLREAVAHGVNHIDTSDFYGPHVTNQLIREALRPIPTISSSSPRSARGAATDGSWLPAFSPEELTQAVHDNLRNLGLDVLDVVNLRIMFDAHGPAEGSIEAPLTVLAELQRQGLVRHIGLSNVTPDADRGRTRGSPRSSACRTSTIWRIAPTTR